MDVKLACKIRMAERSDHPPEYIPIDRCLVGPDSSLEMGTDSLYSGCHCEGKCVGGKGDNDACTCNIAFEESNGRLRDDYLLPESPPVFECNSKCTCSDKCPNRITQHRPSVTLHTFQTYSKGFGVQSTGCICKGTFVGEYIGEIISTDLAIKRLQTLNDTDPCYILQFKEHMSNGLVLTTNIDATYKGNIIRFVNHSCSPNLTMVAVRSDSIVPRLCLFANRDIDALKELCFSYFGKSGSQVALADDIQLGRKVCFCGSESCIGYLPLQT